MAPQTPERQGPKMKQPAALTYSRRGLITHVYLDGEFIGLIKRREGSDSSPRGRAYRTFHHPITADGDRRARCYSRAEAAETLLHAAEQAAAATACECEQPAPVEPPAGTFVTGPSGAVWPL